MYPCRSGHFGLCSEPVALRPSPQSTDQGKIAHIPLPWRSPGSLESPVHADFFTGLLQQQMRAGEHYMARSSWQHAPWWVPGYTPRLGKPLPSVCPPPRGHQKTRPPGKDRGAEAAGLRRCPTSSQVSEAREPSLWECRELDPGRPQSHLPSLRSSYALLRQFGATGDSCLGKRRSANSIMVHCVCGIQTGYL